MVKADAYGHGAIEVASLLNELGVNDYAVSNVTQEIELRKAGIKGQILIIGYTPIEEMNDLMSYDITQALISEEYTSGLVDTHNRIKCQYAIDVLIYG